MKTVIIREFMEHVKSIQFVVLLVFAVTLFSINGVYFSRKYNQLMTVFLSSSQEKSTVSTTLSRQPSPLLFMSEGGDTYRPGQYRLAPKYSLSAQTSDESNYMLPDIPEPDWTFIVSIIFSLYVILLGYNAISGEREQGTMRLILSNPIGRIKLVVSKYATILLTVTAILSAGVLISLIITGLSNPVVFTTGYLARIALMIVLSLAYLSIFAFLSLMLSSLIGNSSLVLMISLALWIFLGIIIPNTSGIIAEKISRVPSEFQTSNQLGPVIQKQLDIDIDTIRERAHKGEIRTEDEAKKEFDRICENCQDSYIKYYNNYDNSMKQRAATAQNLSRISPTALFQYAAENLTGTGIDSEERFMRDIQVYSALYDNYIRKKIGKLVSTSQWSFMTDINVDGKNILVQSPRPEEYQGDNSDFPMFRESRPDIVRSLRDALMDMAGILLWNIVLAMGAFTAFLRADVR
ncbi:ABC transporter permease subunit [bacterium]|nr:ABC transporter permease subunit [bacterium]